MAGWQGGPNGEEQRAARTSSQSAHSRAQPGQMGSIVARPPPPTAPWELALAGRAPIMSPCARISTYRYSHTRGPGCVWIRHVWVGGE